MGELRLPQLDLRPGSPDSLEALTAAIEREEALRAAERQESGETAEEVTTEARSNVADLLSQDDQDEALPADFSVEDYFPADYGDAYGEFVL